MRKSDNFAKGLPRLGNPKNGGPHHQRLNVRGVAAGRQLLQVAAQSGLDITLRNTAVATRADIVRSHSFFVARIWTPAIEINWRRVDELIQRQFMFVFVDSGQIAFDSPEELESTVGGLAMAAPGRSPVRISATEWTEFLLFSFDRNNIDSRLVQQHTRTQNLSVNPVTRGAFACLSALAHPTPEESTRDVAILQTLTRQVAEALVTQVSDEEPAQMSNLDRVREVIEGRFAEAAFSPIDIAQELQVSRRTVENWARREGTQLHKEIRTRRVKEAVELLFDNPKLKAETLAKLSGMGTAASLRRAILQDRKISLLQLRGVAVQSSANTATISAETVSLDGDAVADA